MPLAPHTALNDALWYVHRAQSWARQQEALTPDAPYIKPMLDNLAEAESKLKAGLEKEVAR